jgi:crossover junction endodeoxyribonuclease RuvC
MASAGITVHEYAPASVKLATVGDGQADKRAIGRGIVLRLGLPRAPASDAADALALALCHLHQAPLLRALTGTCGSGQRAGVGGARTRGARI